MSKKNTALSKTAKNLYEVTKAIFFVLVISIILKVLFLLLEVPMFLGIIARPDLSGLAFLVEVPIIGDLLKFIFGGLI